MEIRIEVKGLDEAVSRLDRVSAGTQSRLRDAMRRAVEDIQERARKEHQFTTRNGDAERSIHGKTSFHKDSFEGVVGTTRLVTIYLHQGTRSHIIRNRYKRALRWTAGGQFVFAKRVRHPGTKKDPFIFNAAAHEKRQVISRFERAVRQAIGEAY